MIKTILVATDGSDHAMRAVTLAADIAEKYEAKLILLHVLPQGPLPATLRHMAEVEHLAESRLAGSLLVADELGRAPLPQRISAAAPEAQEVYRAIGEKILAAAEVTAKEKQAAQLETLIADGDPAKEILAQAERTGANLIVMGSRGVSDLKGLLMGSVSHKVSHLATCSCVTVT